MLIINNPTVNKIDTRVGARQIHILPKQSGQQFEMTDQESKVLQARLKSRYPAITFGSKVAEPAPAKPDPEPVKPVNESKVAEPAPANAQNSNANKAPANGKRNN
ncbi:MAG: hypothetical protein IBX50_04210 [Marinospirillum sp.]|uniref:hypothetical protein n=1 Tax=Marinospirillum sp. TaxID=2183934 RepID=UPI0019E1A5D3|nr:hypothetical protein [Marinospirillum sp.]MBE0505910.1 hypothetical protein [Marinospirillum sp.]